VTGPEIWRHLGIPPTTDPAALRLAYAARLKQVRPDTDPAGFRALREAFEAARRLTAGGPGSRASPPNRPPDLAQLTRTQTAPAPPPGPDLPQSIRRHLRQGGILKAARLWNQGVNSAELSFEEEPRLQREIAQALAAAPVADFALLDEAARLMDWEQAARALGAPTAILDVMARRAALVWLETLRSAAAAGWRWRGSARTRNRAARLLLRPAPGRLSTWFPYVLRPTNFAYWDQDLARYRRWLGDALDPERLAWCVASRRRLDARLATQLFALTMAILMIVIGLSVFVVVVSAVVAAVMSFS